MVWQARNKVLAAELLQASGVLLPILLAALPLACQTLLRVLLQYRQLRRLRLPCLRRSKGLSTRLHRVSQSHQLARPLPQLQPPQRAPLWLRLLKSYVNVLACISLETRLVLNSEYIGPVYFFLCYRCPWWCFLQINWYSRSYIKDVFGKSPVLYTFSLGDDLCVNVTNKKLIIEVCKFFQQSDR